jgi:transposase InsO family protein
VIIYARSDQIKITNHPDRWIEAKGATSPTCGSPSARSGYLAIVMDLCSLRLAGWAIADHTCTELVIAAQHAGQRARGGPAWATFHTDPAAQHTSRAFAEVDGGHGHRMDWRR